LRRGIYYQCQRERSGNVIINCKLAASKLLCALYGWDCKYVPSYYLVISSIAYAKVQLSHPLVQVKAYRT
jgi:hypothetical protein